MRVLIAEDDPVSRKILQSSLLKWGYEVDVVSDGHAAWEAIQSENAPKIAILDWMMPGMDGLQLCKAIRERNKGPYIYTILLTAKSQRDDLIDGLKAGADDFIIKPFDPSELQMRLRAGKRVLDLQAKLLAEREAQRMKSIRDPLTGLPNRLLFSEHLSDRLAQAARMGQQIGVMFLDLDRLKFINDSLGHNMGDQLLKLVSKRLIDTVRESDLVARLGGDEFVFVLAPADHPDEYTLLAQRVLSALSKPFVLDGQELKVTGSIGISIYPQDGADAETLVRNADAAMYRAKEQGRNAICLFREDPCHSISTRLNLENELREALEQNRFVIYYQTRLDLQSGLITGVEALIRMNHPELGLLLPRQFIQIAEKSGIIEPITEWVLCQACSQNKLWRDSGYSQMEVAVNISERVLHRANLADVVESALSKTGLSPQFLCLEVTESAILKNPDNATKVLTDIRNMNVRISIDDFGAGYSSLGNLAMLPITGIKIDPSFLKNISSNKKNLSMVKAIVAMAHNLDFSVTAEGVETLEQLELLKGMGRVEVQGYFISRPVPSDEVVHLLAEGAPPIVNWTSLAA